MKDELIIVPPADRAKLMYRALRDIRKKCEFYRRISDGDRWMLLRETVLTEELIAFIEKKSEQFPGPRSGSIQAGLFVAYSHGFNDAADSIMKILDSVGGLGV